MDSNLAAVLIGGALTFAVTLLTHVLSFIKDTLDWKQKRLSEEADWRRSMAKDELLNLRETYENAVHLLGMYLALKHEDRDNMAPDSPAFALVRDAHQALAAICIRHPNAAIKSLVREFVGYPSGNADELLKVVLSLAHQETGLYASELPSIEMPETATNSSDIYQVDLLVDGTFRREQFINGHDYPESVSILCKLSHFTTEQRRLLLDSLPASPRFLPSTFSLPMPCLDKNRNVARSGECWHARVAPTPGNRKAIFSSWEEDYRAELSRLTESTSTG